MAVIVRLHDYMNSIDSPFEVNGKQDYAKVGFAAARWARAALRNARLGEGTASASLVMEISFAAPNGHPAPAESTDAAEDQPPTPRRKRRRK